MQQSEDSTTKVRREREKEIRRQDILAAAARVFSRRGFAESTMEDVAAEAQIAKGTIYLYYETKMALMEAVLVDGNDRLLAVEMTASESATSYRRKIELMVRAMLEFYENNPDFFHVQIQEFVKSGKESPTPRLIMEKHWRTDSLYTQIFSEGVAAGEFKQLPPLLLTNALLGMIGRTVFCSQLPDNDTPLSRQADHLLEIFHQGITNPSSGQ